MNNSMKCRFCGRTAPARETRELRSGVTKITQTRPEGWKSIELELWCGSCDPRERKVG